jgi:hypothetical protein
MYGPVTGLNLKRGRQVYGEEMEVKGAWADPGGVATGVLNKHKDIGYIVIDGEPLRTKEEWSDYWHQTLSHLLNFA